MEYILASRSPRRKQLLSLILEEFRTEESHFDESTITEKNPEQLVKLLSYHKARTVAAEYPGAVVIGADTVVVSPDGEIFGIPANEEEAMQMMKSLSGRTHRVMTGVSLICGEKELSFCCKTDVCFRRLENEEITSYLATGEPFDKAGGYGIQGKAAVFVSRIEGDYYNVVGLPVSAVYEALRKF